KQNKTLAFEVSQAQKVWDSAKKTNQFSTQNAWVKLDQKIKASEPKASNNIYKWAIGIAAMLIFTAGIYLLNSPESATKTIHFAENQSLFDLPDGSKVIANANATIKYNNNFSDTERRVELSGEAFFDVERDTLKPFIVATDLGTIKVLGTEFNVKTTQNGQLRVSVQEGKVQVTSPSNEQVVLTKGQSAYYDKATRNLISKNESFDLFWINKTLKFRESSLKMVFNILEKNYNINIDVYDPEILNCTYTGTFKNAPIDTVFNVLSIGFENLKIIKSDTNYEISGSCN
ncbi:MAG: FecR family protein, partial [Bacteroidia bacterium]